MMARNRRIQPHGSPLREEEFRHDEEEGIEDALPRENDHIKIKTLYLKLSTIFGVQPLHGRMWPTICLLVVTATTAAAIGLTVNAHWANWKAHGKALMADLLCLFGVTNANACMVMYFYMTGKNMRILSGILGQINQNLRWPNAFVVFEGVCFFVGGAAHWDDPPNLKVITQEIGVVFNFIVVLILAQYGAILNHFSYEITQLKDQLQKTGSSEMMPTLKRYFHIRKMIGQTNEIYSSQMVFVVAKVFLKSVVMGYFLITRSEAIIRVVSTVMPEAAMLIFITMNCYKTQNAANLMNLELFRALRNHPELHCDKKLALVLKLNKQLDFTAGSFLKLGNGLITSMVAAVTTYLVTLVDLSGE